MAQTTAIEWTETTWNPVTGCNKISPGCKNCYAERLAKRLHAMGNPRYSNGFDVTIHRDLLDTPKRWRKPKLIFVNSMSDVFHPDVGDDFIQDIFNTIRPRVTLIKYSLSVQRGLRTWLQIFLGRINLWMGTSVENSDYVCRIDSLREIPASVRFLSCEPLLGSLAGLNLDSIHWLIAGGESGPRARSLAQNPEWVLNLRDQCLDSGVPFFFKQWGGRYPKAGGNLLDGKLWMEMPLSHH